MGNIWYNEPKTLDVAFDVIGDIVLSAASQQYGGFTVPEVDKILEPPFRGYKGAVRIGIFLVPHIHNGLAFLIYIVHHPHEILFIIPLLNRF